MKILLVDDHSILRDGMRYLLSREKDFSVVAEASSLVSAVAAARLHKPDLVIMDLQLPDGSGLDATRMIKSELPQTKVLIVSGSRPDRCVHQAMEAGASGFVYKEDASSELVRALRNVIAGKNYLCPAATTAFFSSQGASAPDHGPESTGEGELSERERQVLRCVAEGMRNKEIADELKVGVKSVETYRSRLMRKLGCESAADLVRYAVKNGISRL